MISSTQPSPKKIDRQLALQGAWVRGLFNYKLHKAQRLIDAKFETSPHTLFFANCSRQFGKTFWAVKIAEQVARRIPKAQIRFAAAFQSDLLDYIIPAFEKFEEDCPEVLKSKYMTSGSRQVFHNGSIIKFVGVDKKPDGLRGNTLDLIILDEASFYDDLDYLYKSIVIPATMHRPNAKVIIPTTPPSTPAHDVCEYARRAQLEGGYSEFTIYDNPLVDEQTIQRLMRESGGEDSTTWKREYLCQFVVDSNLCIIPEWREDRVQETIRDEYHTYYHKYVSMDLGRKDHTAIIFAYYDFKRATLVIEDEITLDGPVWTTNTMVESIRAKEYELWKDGKVTRRISDNNNEHLIIDLQSIHNLSFTMTNKESLEAMVNEVRLWTAAGRIVVNPKCKMLIGCLKYGVWDDKRKEFARSKTYGHFDMLAALIYLVRNTIVNTNPIPALHGIDQTRAWIQNVDHRGISKNAKAIEGMFKKNFRK